MLGAQLTQSHSGWIFSILSGLSIGIKTVGYFNKYMENGTYLKICETWKFQDFLSFAKMSPEICQIEITKARW